MLYKFSGLRNLTVSARFMVVLAIGFTFQAGISIVSLIDLKQSLIQDRQIEVKHLLEAGYSIVAFYHDQASKGLMTDAAARRAAIDAVRAMHYDNGNYFFIWDRNGTSIAHGAQPDLEGKTFINSPDADANPVVAFMARKLIEVANSEAREGLTKYRIPKRGQKVALDKIAYSRLFVPWGWSVGTGAYLDDIDTVFRTRALSVLARTVVLIALACGLTFVIGRDLAFALRRLSRRVASVARGELEGDIPDVDRSDEVGVMARALLVLRDTSKEAAELRLDQLTGLPTRKLLMDRMKQVAGRTARGGNFSALLLIDLDRFKAVNDSHGHDVGDMLLREVARRLSACVREGDTVARLGGDEFVVVLVDIGYTEQKAVAAAETVFKKILSVLEQPYQFGKVTHVGTASIGVTLIKGDGVSVESLLKQADLAMYEAKQSGRNTCHFFDGHMEDIVREREGREKDLLQAIVDGDFVLYFQPRIGIEGTIVAAEALVRWNHPRRGLVSPDEFISLSEETGLILPLGHWVLEAACRQLADWAARPDMANITVAVNVSAGQFRQVAFVDEVLAILDKTGADPARLMLELTESLLVHELKDTIEKMSELKRRGVKFALDDFGTGYSSMYSLKHLPLDQLKIDRSFTRDVLRDQNDAAIVGMMVSLGRALGLDIVAEGVETADHHVFMVRAGCETCQGHYFSPPLAVAAFEVFTQAWTPPAWLRPRDGDREIEAAPGPALIDAAA